MEGGLGGNAIIEGSVSDAEVLDSDDLISRPKAVLDGPAGANEGSDGVAWSFDKDAEGAAK